AGDDARGLDPAGRIPRWRAGSGAGPAAGDVRSRSQCQSDSHGRTLARPSSPGMTFWSLARMDQLIEKFHAIEWLYADKDAAALAALEERIAEAGRQLKLITYSDLARGVVFHLPQIRD